MSVQEIEAIGKVLVPLGLGFLGYLQAKCRQDLNIAHAMLRAKESGKPWQAELRSNYRLFRSRKRRKKDADTSTQNADETSNRDIPS